MLIRGKGKNKFDTNRTGSISESAITTRFLERDYEVFFPTVEMCGLIYSLRTRKGSSGAFSVKQDGLRTVRYILTRLIIMLQGKTGRCDIIEGNVTILRYTVRNLARSISFQ